jgi:hypothetical protein
MNQIQKKKDDQIGIFDVLVRLEEPVDASQNPGWSLLHPQLGVKTTQKPFGCAPNHFLLKVLWKYI